MSSSPHGAVKHTASSLPPFKGKGNRGWLSKAECQQVLACANTEYDKLRQQIKLIGQQPIFEGKALLRQNLNEFDPDGAHRARLWVEVERSSPLFAELFSGTRQNCDSSTWNQFLGRVKYSMLKNLSKRSESAYSDESELTDTTQGTTSSGGKTSSIPSKRSSGSEDFDFSSHSRPLRKRFETFKVRDRGDSSPDRDNDVSADEAMSDSEDVIAVAPRKSKSLRKHFQVSIAPSSKVVDSNPLPGSAALFAEPDELSIDNRYSSVETSGRHGQPITRSVGLEVQQLFNQRLDERTAALGLAYDARLTQQLAAERERLGAMFEDAVQRTARQEIQKHESAREKEAEAKIAACKKIYESIIIEKETELAAEKTKMESINEEKEAQIAALKSKYEAEIMERDAQIAAVKMKWEAVIEEKEVQLAAEKTQFEADIKAEAEAQMAIERRQIDSVVEKKVQEHKVKMTEFLQSM
ncbi:hypothetical protein CKM354_000227500 [Cercospora kikuchii]|uniref:Uncharacterized protein n=1 Tax=Cercospora kikuchii TaxID=84275 RepID=A0A9P3C9W6_9PEZI|nr:uncharacterized protein CKM354_000227500 [Cercospora kikuchii]GIZ38876.1 hypothetical protein CKM354_000227500 [Cercospora kikuchii]